jgi:hypothetical protein
MNIVAPQTTTARRLNHVEFVHPPGEQHLVFALFELIGVEITLLKGGQVIMGLVDSTSFKYENNDNYLAGREVRPEQWAFDQALMKAIRQQPLADAFSGYQDLLYKRPQWGMHFGIHFSSLETWEAAVVRMQNAETLKPELKGRVKLNSVHRPEDPDPLSTAHQAFIWTDLIASGSLALGQRIELSALVNFDPKTLPT